MVKTVEGERLVLTNVHRTDMGGYLCIASNGVPPSVSKRFDVHINCKYQNNNSNNSKHKKTLVITFVQLHCKWNAFILILVYMPICLRTYL